MRILHVGVGNLGGGGVATYVRTVSGAQALQGHDILVAELWPGPESMPEVSEILDGVPALERLRRRWKADVVHLHSQLPDYRGIDASTVLTTHDHQSHCPTGGRYLEARGTVCERPFGVLGCLRGIYLERCGSRHPAHFLRQFRITAGSPSFPGRWICPSRYGLDWLLRMSVDPSRATCIPNPGPEVYPEAPDAETTEPRILFLGRLVPNKGCDVLVRAMEFLPADARLDIVGDGPERGALEAAALRSGAGDRIRFHGWLPAAGTRERLCSSRVLAVPSLWPEPFGLVALEAAAAGRPVVASAVGGLRDTVEDGSNGRLVPAGDVRAMAEALAGYLRDPGLAHLHGERGRTRVVEKHSIADHLSLLGREYELAAAVSGTKRYSGDPADPESGSPGSPGDGSGI